MKRNCLQCKTPLAENSRDSRLFCNVNCRVLWHRQAASRNDSPAKLWDALEQKAVALERKAAKARSLADKFKPA